MSKKVVLWVSVLAVLTTVFSSCQEKPIENPDLPGVVTARERMPQQGDRIVPGGTFSVVNEDETGQETAFIEDASGETENTEFPKVTPANEMYNIYPMKIIYPERQRTSLTVTIETAKDDVYTDDGRHAAEFTAEYPLISGTDETVCQRINNEIKLFIDGTIDEFRKYTKDTEVVYEPTHKWEINMDGVDFAGDGYDINGNILTVYFAYHTYGAPAAHGSEAPTPMIFDLRTGDRVYFSDLIADSDGLAKTLESWFNDYLFAYGAVPYGMLDAEEYVDILRKSNDGTSSKTNSEQFGMDSDGIFRVAGNDADERMTVYNGCVGFYLSAYEYGSFADGVRRVDIPVNDILPYLGDKGKSLFEGYTSGSSVPANVIEYKGGKYFDTTMWVPNIVNESAPTEGDIEFVSLFETAWRHHNKLYGTGQD